MLALEKNRHFGRWSLIASVFVVVFLAGPAHAVWEHVNWSTIYEPTSGVLVLETCSDEQGGSLVATVDPGASALKIRVSRIDHSGNEIWGDGGVNVPFNLSADAMDGPVAIAADGTGGAYVGYREIYGTQHILTVAHFAADGTHQWSQPVGDFIADDAWLAVDLVGTGGGECFAVWTQKYPYPGEKITAARIALSGSVTWTADTGLGIDLAPDPELWFARSDAQGGLFVVTNHNPFLETMKHRVQRINGAGSLLWGSAGTLVWDNMGLIYDVVPDGSGGCFAINSTGYGNAYGQHLNAAGTATWAAGGILIHDLATWPNPCGLSVCSDGSGGFYLVQGVTDLVGQRVDGSGANVWGSAGITLTSLAGWQQLPHVAPDGFGGMLLTYQDHYFSDFNDQFNRALSAMRVDGFGTKLWQFDAFFWTLAEGQTGLTPYGPRIVPDGSGGGQVLWQHFAESWGTNDICAAGLGADGTSPAAPKLTYLWPDAGLPGQVLPVTILGDYLDASQTFAVQQGGSDFAVTATAVTGSKVVTGDLDLTGAAPGAYDLDCTVGGTSVASMVHAFGVGDLVPCTEDRPLEVPPASVTSFGSLRKAAIGSDGRGHFAWLQYNSDSGSYEVQHWIGEDGSGASQAEFVTSAPARDLAFALDPADGAHYAFVTDDGLDQYLLYGHDTNLHLLPVIGGVRAPAMVVDGTGAATIVYESDVGGVSNLFEVRVDNNSGFGTPVNLGSGAGCREPDLSFAPQGLALTFVRDFWFPGLKEVCYQLKTAGGWQAPVGMYFGLIIKSPAVAWDLDQNLLFCFVLDNTGSAPLLHTAKMTAGTLGQVRWRLGDGLIYRCSVAAADPNRFTLMTQESESGLPMQVYLREGDGEVFFPRRRVNTHGDVDWPVLAVQPGGNSVITVYEDYQNGGDPFSVYYCAGSVSAIEDIPMLAAAPLAASPNPFNPQTTFKFTLDRAQWVRLEIFDVRGRKVRTLQDGRMPGGAAEITWKGKDDNGQNLASGVFFGRLRTPAADQVAKITLIK